jgi:septal ring factor EnvC (AmiA/AmiB activator)
VPKENEIHCAMPSKTSDLMPDLNAVLKKLSTVEESRSRLKEKTKQLLRQYRDKRSLLERRERQLMSQRAGLEQLQLLLRSQNSCQLLVLRHTASHLQELARLLAALLPEREPPPHLSEENIFNSLFIIFFFLPYFPSCIFQLA